MILTAGLSRPAVAISTTCYLHELSLSDINQAVHVGSRCHDIIVTQHTGDNDLGIRSDKEHKLCRNLESDRFPPRELQKVVDTKGSLLPALGHLYQYPKNSPMCVSYLSLRGRGSESLTDARSQPGSRQNNRKVLTGDQDPGSQKIEVPDSATS